MRSRNACARGLWQRPSVDIGHTGRRRERKEAAAPPLLSSLSEWRGARGAQTLSQRMVPWCSGLAYVPVKDEIAGSNPVGTADVNYESEQRCELRLRAYRADHPHL